MSRVRANKSGCRFGKLVVMYHDEQNPSYVICRCDCGNIHRARIDSLTRTKNPVRSCGCLRVQTARMIGNTYGITALNKLHEFGKEFGTNFGIIEKKSLDKRNKSGHTGVWHDLKRGNYRAYININGKQKILGKFKEYNDAVKAREEAEEMYYLPLIEAKNARLQLAT